MYILTAYLFVCHLEDKVTDSKTCSWNNGKLPPLIQPSSCFVGLLGSLDSRDLSYKTKSLNVEGVEKGIYM